jgi:hypothetical protein
MLCLFHDTGEARMNDLHRVSKRYIEIGRDEQRALSEQVERLPQNIADNIMAFFEDYEGRLSVEGRLARDADLLECIVQAREYQDTLMSRIGSPIALRDCKRMSLASWQRHVCKLNQNSGGKDSRSNNSQRTTGGKQHWKCLYSSARAFSPRLCKNGTL